MNYHQSDSYHYNDNLIHIDNSVNTDNYLKNDNYLSVENYCKIRFMKNFGSKLKQLRGKAGLTQAEVASMLGLTLTNYNPIENNKRGVSDSILKKIANIKELDVSYEELKAWKALDQLDPDTITEAAKALPVVKRLEILKAAYLEENAKPEDKALYLDRFFEGLSELPPDMMQEIKKRVDEGIRQAKGKK